MRKFVNFIDYYMPEIIFGFMLASLTGFLVTIFVTGKHEEERNHKRQQEINTFYVKHQCKPEGYVAGRYQPIRTYRCDNGLFVAGDMKE